MRRPLALTAITLLAGIASACDPFASSGPTPTPGMPSVHPFREDLVANFRGGDIEVMSSSVAGPEPGVIFPFSLGHCGLGSPVDVDQSLWDPIGANDAQGGPVDTDVEIGELINATSGEAIIVGANRLDFRTPSGIVVVFVRLDGPRGYPGCM
jgi:hypothetical protein